MVLFKTDNLTFAYPAERDNALRDVNLQIRRESLLFSWAEQAAVNRRC